ncbi:NUDIX hydrolase [Peptoniphilus raoultii]|uniref:NUDIX hydrolase n=1 Tax=Peptoniphilus raoultii TaxID=1776387 RepID=UPI0008D96D2C|nr:NUDIX hydrolase [Peptoniphilus raoultii]
MSQIERTMKSDKIYEGRILTLKVDTVEMEGKKYTKREIIEHPPVVCVIAITDEGNILLVKQYRKAVDRELIELPAGFIEIDEEPKSAAIRETCEETGFYPHKCEYVSEFYTSPGFSNEKVYFFMARDLEKREQNLDEFEDISFEEVSLERALELIDLGDIIDAKTISGILLYERIKNRSGK